MKQEQKIKKIIVTNVDGIYYAHIEGYVHVHVSSDSFNGVIGEIVRKYPVTLGIEILELPEDGK